MIRMRDSSTWLVIICMATLAIACQAGIEGEQVIERISAMLEAGTIRRVRQTVMATSLAPGALVAWDRWWCRWPRHWGRG